MINLPLWILRNKFPSVYDSESATAIEMTSKLYGAMQELVDEYNKFAEECNTMINEFTLSSEQDAHKFEVAMSQKFKDFIDVVELKLTSYENGRDEFTNTANSLLETLRQANESFKTDLTGEFNTHKSAVDQKLQEYERDTEVSWNELTDKPFDAETVRGTLRQIYSGSPTWNGTRATITPSEPLKFNTEYSIIIDDDITYNCKVGSEGVLGFVTFTYTNKFRFTEDGLNITFEMLDGTKPAKITITVIEETVVHKMLDPMFIPKEINVPWEYIINAPFGRHVQNAIYWDGEPDITLDDNGVAPYFDADGDNRLYLVTDMVCHYGDIIKGGGFHNTGSWATGNYVETKFTGDEVVKISDELFFIRKNMNAVFVCLKDNFTIGYEDFYKYWTIVGTGNTGTLTIPKKGIYMLGLGDFLYPDTFYINDYKFESYEPLPDELLGEIPEQIDELTERVAELEENGGESTVPLEGMFVKKIVFTSTQECLDWYKVNASKFLHIIFSIPGMGELKLDNTERFLLDGEITCVDFSNFSTLKSVDDLRIIATRIRLSAEGLEYDGKTLSFNSSGTVGIEQGTQQTIPHEYASTMGVVTTVLYID